VVRAPLLLWREAHACGSESLATCEPARPTADSGRYGRTTLVAIFLGIDGGGSKTSCLIGDEHSVLGSGAAAGSNVVRVGEAQARAALANAVQQACAGAKINPSQISRTCIGLAGAARPGMSELVRRMMAEIVSGEIQVTGDMVITLEAAFGPGPGVIVIAGTGSIAYGRDAKGEIARAGGWGFAVSDEGSGHWIGQTAISWALRARDQGKSAEIFGRILKAWHLETDEQLILAANATPPPNFAALFPVVLSAAESGDAVAVEILTKAGGELADLAGIVMRRIFSDAEGVPVAMSGGVFGNSAQVREVFYNRLSSEFSGIVLNENVVEPVVGALELARRGAR
jgi:glucosamine kinase